MSAESILGDSAFVCFDFASAARSIFKDEITLLREWLVSLGPYPSCTNSEEKFKDIEASAVSSYKVDPWVFNDVAPVNNKNRPRDVPKKYWGRRFFFWSRFNEGVWMDRDAWFEVTPENVAKRTAEEIRSLFGDVCVVDPCAGVGGNIIQCALANMRCLALDLKPNRVQMAKHNAEVYGVAGKVKFYVADFFHVMKCPEVRESTCILLSPPWGGPNYSEDVLFFMDDLILRMIRHARKLGKYMVLYLPRQTCLVQIAFVASYLGLEVSKMCTIVFARSSAEYAKALLVFLSSRDRSEGGQTHLLGPSLAAGLMRRSLVQVAPLAKYLASLWKRRRF